MRVLSISTLFPNPARPAFGNFVRNQMLAAAAIDEVDLTMVSPVGIPPWPLSLREPYRSLAKLPQVSDFSGLPVHYPPFRTIPKVGGDSNPDRIVEAVLPLARALHEQAPFDLVDASFFFPDGPAVARIATALGLPYTVKSRGADIHYWGKRPAALAQMVEAAQRASLMLAVSEALKADMVALGMPKERIVVHYTGLDREAFKPVERKAARALVSAIPSLGVWSEGPLIVTPGALIAIKGQRLAIEALTDLPGAHLALAGAGEEEEALRAHAAELGLADRVQFLGQVSHDLLPRLFSAADVVVLPSEREGLANVWVEALACGTPLVIPDIGGAHEVVRDDSAGRIAPRHPRAIAAAVRAILDDPPSQQAVAANAARFSWEANATELVGIWRNAAGRNR